MKLSDFSKGLSTRLDPILIGLNEAVVYSNIDNTSGLLRSAKSYTSIQPIAGKWFYLFNDVWYSSLVERDYIEYKNKLLWTEKDAKAKKVVNGVEKLLGLEAAVPVLITVDGGAGSISASPETVQYTYTYYDSSEGIESVAAPLSDELALGANRQVSITNITPSNNSAIDIIRLYRLGAGTTEPTLLIELPANTISYTDNIPTLNALGNLLASNDNYPPVTGLRFLSLAYGILFGALGDKLYFSKIGQPDAWPSTQTIDIDGDITAIFPIQDGILIFTIKRMYLLVGTNISEFRLIPVGTEHGCNSHKSCKFVKTLPVWSSNDGVCAYSSGNVNVISKEKLGLLTLDIINTAIYDEQYYICLADGTLFVVDFRFGLAFKQFDFRTQIDINVDDVGTFDNVLYGIINGNIVTLFTGDNLSIRYVSPELTEEDASVTKMYNNIYIRADGDFVVNILIDGVKVSSSSLTGNTIHDIKPPQEKQRGSSIQYDITGTGVIKEIEYKVVGRQNGR